MEVEMSLTTTSQFDYAGILRRMSHDIPSIRKCILLEKNNIPEPSAQLFQLASSHEFICHGYFQAILKQNLQWSAMLAATVTGAGNCLFNSTSFLIAGNQKFADKLRVRTAFEMVLNEQLHRYSAAAAKFACLHRIMIMHYTIAQNQGEI